LPVGTGLLAGEENDENENVQTRQREYILETLASLGGSRKLTCERLRMSERTLRYKLKQYREAGLLNE
jgi:two-component system response regulator FlrC